MIVLECLPFPETHTAENWSKVLKKVLQQYGILNKVHLAVRDNGANVVCAMNLAGLKHTGCFLHTLNLVVKNGFKSHLTIKNLLEKVHILSLILIVVNV